MARTKLTVSPENQRLIEPFPSAHNYLPDPMTSFKSSLLVS